MLNWLLFIALCGYNVLDVYQTKLLMDYGAQEGNLFLLFVMAHPNDIHTIIIVKSIIISVLGIGIYLNNKVVENGR